MGIAGLLGLLKTIQKPTSLEAFRGQTLGVDAYCWLHRGAIGAAIELAQGKPTVKHVNFAMQRIRMLIHFGITPYVVFDGDALPSKGGTEQDRAKRRTESKALGLSLLRSGKIGLAYQELQKSVDVTPEMAAQFISELKANSIQYVVAPYEADAQLAYLEQKKHINGIISEDSDLLVFGAKVLLTKLDQYGECVMLRQADLNACREVSFVGWSLAEFRRMAILNGCDYLPGIPKLGLKSAHRLVRKHRTLDRLIRGIQLETKFKLPDGYHEAFQQAEMTFLYQYVFCPVDKCLVHLNTPEDRNQLEGIQYIGKYVEPDLAQRVADGFTNPMTKEPICIDHRPHHMIQNSASSRRAQSGKPDKPDKPIESFFKRMPLAELDPNMFHPTPSQLAAQVRNANRTWTATETPQQPSSAPRGSLWSFGVHQGPSRVAPSSAPPLRAQKRQRLSDENSMGTTSRFFSTADPSPSVRQSTARSRRRGNSDFQIWSDDSINDDMNHVMDKIESQPGTQSQADMQVSTLPKSHSQSAALDRLQASMDCFRDDADAEAPPSLRASCSTITASEPKTPGASFVETPSFEADVESPDVVTKEAHSSPFSASLLKQTQKLRKDTSAARDALLHSRPSAQSRHSQPEAESTTINETPPKPSAANLTLYLDSSKIKSFKFAGAKSTASPSLHGTTAKDLFAEALRGSASRSFGSPSTSRVGKPTKITSSKRPSTHSALHTSTLKSRGSEDFLRPPSSPISSSPTHRSVEEDGVTTTEAVDESPTERIPASPFKGQVFPDSDAEDGGDEVYGESRDTSKGIEEADSDGERADERPEKGSALNLERFVFAA